LTPLFPSFQRARSPSLDRGSTRSGRPTNKRGMCRASGAAGECARGSQRSRAGLTASTPTALGGILRFSTAREKSSAGGASEFSPGRKAWVCDRQFAERRRCDTPALATTPQIGNSPAHQMESTYSGKIIRSWFAILEVEARGTRLPSCGYLRSLCFCSAFSQAHRSLANNSPRNHPRSKRCRQHSHSQARNRRKPRPFPSNRISFACLPRSAKSTARSSTT